MTTINRPLRRESGSTGYSRGRARPIIVELSPPGRLVGFRLKGERKTYYLDVGVCYGLAVRAHVESERARKLAERKARKQA